MPFAWTLDTKIRRYLIFALFYIAEGLPLGFTLITLPAYLRREGVTTAGVGAIVAASYVPWAFKWAWAPLVDLIRVQRTGPSRTWIIACELGMILMLAGMFGFHAASNVALVSTLILLHNIFTHFIQ